MATSSSKASVRKFVQIGSTPVNNSDLGGLRRAWQRNQLVLFLGAGISLAHGIPTWKNLVLEMLFDQTEHAGRMKRLAPHYRRALASWMADYFEYNPVILARMIEDQIHKRAKGKPAAKGEDPFLEHVREHLYASCRENPGDTTLKAIAKFVQKSRGHLPAVVTFNFDDLLERELTSLQVSHLPVFNGDRRPSDALPIVHPHGFIPKTGPLPEGIVFTERHYHALTETIFHWALTEIVHHLRHHTVLFIGLSMSDPNLRRLLDACQNSDIPPHWQVQRRHSIRDSERDQVAETIERSAGDWARILKGQGEDPQLNIQKEIPELMQVINGTLRQADTYDDGLFEKMGVKTIWIEDFGDIPTLLEAIAQPEAPTAIPVSKKETGPRRTRRRGPV